MDELATLRNLCDASAAIHKAIGRECDRYVEMAASRGDSPERIAMTIAGFSRPRAAMVLRRLTGGTIAESKRRVDEMTASIDD